MDGSVHEEKSSFQMLGLTFSFKLYWVSYIITIAKTASKKNCLDSFYEVSFSSRLLCVSINLPYGHVWNAVVRGYFRSIYKLVYRFWVHLTWLPKLCKPGSNFFL